MRCWVKRTMERPAHADAAPIPGPALRQALDWQVTFWSGEVTDAERAAFRRWLAADPRHERAWHDVQRIDATLAAVPPKVGGRVLRRPAASRPARRKALRALGGLAGGGMVALAVLDTPQWRAARADYATVTGERHELLLEDGTRVSLNTATAIDVRFDAGQRVVVLHQGEILVTTAPDAARPFLVDTRQGSLRALGTRFSVRREEDAIAVAVFEGAVEIRPRDKPDLRRRVDAGQRTRFDARAIAAVAPADPLDTAWTRGLLIAERLPLAAFLARLARHRPGLVHCDAAVAGLVVSGVYPLDDTDRVLAALADALPVRVDYLTRYWVTVRGRRP